MRKFVIILLVLCSFQVTRAQVVTDLFQPRTELSKSYHDIAKKYQALELNADRLKTLQNSASEDLALQLPFENGQITLDLKKVKIIADNFTVIEAGPNGSRNAVDYSGAVFYHGNIVGQPSSFAAISLVGNEVVGVIADNKSNIILGTIENNGSPTNEYTLYRESDLKITNPLNCFTSDEYADGEVLKGNNGNTQNKLTAVGEPVDIYFECDFKFYQDKSSNTINVINYVLGFFNNTALLYANEDINVQVSQILVWTTQDPEAAAGLNTTSAVLNAFSSRMSLTDYIGDYAHFLSTRALGGGIAWLLGNPCASSKFNRSAVSAINNTYLNYPTYSWTVQVVTHEMGHNLGSHHTHWCGWTGGAIDNCAAVENGPCASGPTPTNGGTIMSYCHLSGIGINFNNGFGPQPGATIRAVVGSAACFGNCRMTIVVNKQDASCNQNNGTATITATNSTGALTYLWSNGQTGATLTNAAPGTYHVTVKDAGGCQVMEDFTIGNSGTTLSFTLTPSGNGGFCSGKDITLVATNNPAYTYTWKRDGNTIVGATSNTYTTNIAGNYSLTVVSGACSGTASVQIAQLAAPVANITPASSTTFCNGGSVILDANAGTGYTYQWYIGGVPISGAIASTYTSTSGGNYSVKVSAGNNCEATSSNTAVTVNSSPSAIISAGSVTSFCQGGSVQLSASAGTGYTYKWYKNGTPISGATTSVYTANSSGNYTVETTIGPCSKTSDVTTVTVWPIPVVTVTAVPSTIPKFQTTTLTGTGAPNFDWGSQPGFVGTNTPTEAVFRPLATTLYTIKGWDGNGCENTTTVTVTVIGCGPVTDISHTVYSPSSVLIKWTNPTDVTTDTLQYRKAGTTTWEKIFVTGNSYMLNNLAPNTDYEYNIIPLCTTTNVFIPSATAAFKTKALENGLYLRLKPNPAPAGTKSILEIITDANFTLDAGVYDNNGKLVITLASSESHSAGQVIKDFYTDRLANGVYHIGISINGKKHVIKMLVAH